MGKPDKIILGKGSLFFYVEDVSIFKSECEINKLITRLNLGKFCYQNTDDPWKIKTKELKSLVFKKS